MAYEIKKLEWDEDETTYRAIGLHASYCIYKNKYEKLWHTLSKTYGTLDEAKAATQSHHEAQIKQWLVEVK